MIRKEKIQEATAKAEAVLNCAVEMKQEMESGRPGSECVHEIIKGLQEEIDLLKDALH